MSEPTAVAAPVEQVKAEEVKPLEPSTLAAEETKPVEVTEAPSTAEETKAEEVAPVTTATEEKPVETATKEEAPVEPITSGVLGYKAPGLIKHLKSSKRYFWLGDEAISTQHLSHYLRGTEARIAHPVAAWSSQTGKGLLYLVKSESEKSHPQDVIALADATNLQKGSPHEFSFKIHGDKHTFKAANDAERNGWFSAIEKTIEEAKTSKDDIRKSEGYQESIKHLGKPAALAGGVAAGGVAAAATKKEEETATEPVEDAARINSAESSSSDEAAKKEKKEAKKSRSVSRGKRASIFESLLGKKEDKEAKKEEEKVEEKHTAEGAAAGTVVAGGAAATAIAVEDKPEEVKTDDKPEVAEVAAPAAPAAIATTEPEKKEDVSASPRPSKRNSIFGSFYQKVRSPTHEKKEADVAPIVPPKDDAPVIAEPLAPVTIEPTETTTTAPAITEPVEPAAESNADEAAVPAAVATTAVATEDKEAKAETPKKEKESFFGSLLSKARAKSPAANKRDAKEATAVEAPAVPPKDDKPVEEAKIDEPLTGAAATETPALATATETEAPATTAVEPTEVKAASPKESRRRSFFGGFGSSNKKEGEHTEGENKFGNLFRRPSAAIRRATEKKEAEKENVAPVKTEETAAETVGDATLPTTATTAATDAPEAVTEKPTETIGDVPVEAISVGAPQEAHTTVSATA